MCYKYHPIELCQVSGEVEAGDENPTPRALSVLGPKATSLRVTAHHGHSGNHPPAGKRSLIRQQGLGSLGNT